MSVPEEKRVPHIDYHFLFAMDLANHVSSEKWLILKIAPNLDVKAFVIMDEFLNPSLANFPRSRKMIIKFAKKNTSLKIFKIFFRNDD